MQETTDAIDDDDWIYTHNFILIDATCASNL